MAEDRIGAIRARVEAATPGPWRWHLDLEYKQIDLRAPGYTVMAFFRWGMRMAAPAFLHDRWLLKRPHEGTWPHPDAELIANAPADLTFLLDDRSRLKRELLLAQQRIDRMIATPAGHEWDDGFKTGCELAHSLVCDAAEGQRDALVEEILRRVQQLAEARP